MGVLFSKKKIKPTDTIIEINGIDLNTRYFHRGRYLICYSKQLEEYIKEKNYDINNGFHRCLIENLVVSKYFNDIKIIKIIKN
jgi:hypothetical protein